MRVSKDYADLNNRYVELVDAEPVSLFSYAELQFILAEAAVRGWITGTPAQEYYAAGIMDAMRFTAHYTPDVADYHHNMKMDEAYIQAYPYTDPVALSGSDEHKNFSNHHAEVYRRLFAGQQLQCLVRTQANRLSCLYAESGYQPQHTFHTVPVALALSVQRVKLQHGKPKQSISPAIWRQRQRE